MTQLDALFGPLAESLLLQFGKVVTYMSVADGAYDTNTLTSTPVTTSWTMRAAVIRPSGNQFDGDLIRVGDRKIIAASRSFTVAPKANDKIVIDNVEWKVMVVNPIYSGELIAAYELFARA